MNLLDTEVTEGLFESLKIEQNNKYHVYNVRDHLIYTVLGTKLDTELRWAALLHDIGKKKTLTTDKNGYNHFYGHPDISVEMAGPFLHKIGYSKDVISNILSLIKMHDYFNSTSSDGQTKIKVKKVREIIGTHGLELTKKLIELKEADIKSQSELSYLSKINTLNELRKITDIVGIDGTGINRYDLDISFGSLSEMCGEYTDKITSILLKNVWGNPETNKNSILIRLATNELKKLKKR